MCPFRDPPYFINDNRSLLNFFFDVINSGKCHKGHQKALQSVKLIMGRVLWSNYKLQFSNIPLHNPILNGRLKTHNLSDG